jgi:hypothetical protein
VKKFQLYKAKLKNSVSGREKPLARIAVEILFAQCNAAKRLQCRAGKSSKKKSGPKSGFFSEQSKNV